MRTRHLIAFALVILVTALPVFASHGWGSYHWSRSCGTCPRSITLYRSLTTTNTNWSDHLQKSVFGDPANPNSANRRGWNDSEVLTLSIAASATDSSTRYYCTPPNGAVRVCNYSYGANGWLGLAQIWTVTGTTHIARGSTKVNDTYFNGGYPNTEKRHVMCQEVGHDFGLGHTSENGSSQNTCMDYYQNTSNSDWTSTGPNQHDFDQLRTQHHWGTTNAMPTLGEALESSARLRLPEVEVDINEPWQWGTPVEFGIDGKAVIYEREIGGYTVFTHVYWVDPHKHGDDHGDDHHHIRAQN